MTLEEARQIIGAMNRQSLARFTPKEREAIIVAALAWKMGEISDEQASEIFGVDIFSN